MGPKLRENFNDEQYEEILENDPLTSFQFEEVTFEEVLKLLQQLSPSKACGVDGLTAHLIKACGDTIIPPLLHIFNISLKYLIFPNIWKIAWVTALHKEGQHSDANNYRPILVLPILSKIFERIVHDRVYEFVMDADILDQ